MNGEGAKDPPDIVAQLQARARRNPWTAKIIVVGLALTAALSILTNLVALIERVIGWFYK